MKNLKIKLSGLIILSVLFFYAKAQNCWDPLDSTYTMGFEDIELAEFNLWTLNDDNYDEQNWDRLEWIEFPHSGSYSLITRLYGDWAISRCFYLEQGKEYEISFWHFTFNWDPDQNLILAVGDSAKGSRMSDTLLNLEGLGNTSRKQLKAIAKFKPIITGTYYFGWKADGYSSWGTTRISIDDIEIKEFACTATVDLGTDDTICEGSSKQLDAGADFTTYLWKKDGVQVGTERYLTVDTSGTYKVEVKDQFNCETNDEINISLFTYPEVLNVIAGGDTVICDKDSVMLSTN
ncbi:MAG: hypothetical protein KA792_08515, partial [Bacteroidales bacterium]|nr:hypothetical protein [Bacteroidales bacterium]